MEEYGERLYGYSIKSSKYGKQLCRFSRESSGREIEAKLGVIQESKVIYHGPVRVDTWELKNGKNYYYM